MSGAHALPHTFPRVPTPSHPSSSCVRRSVSSLAAPSTRNGRPLCRPFYFWRTSLRFPSYLITSPPPSRPHPVSQVGFGLGGAFDSQGGLSGVFSAILGPVVGHVLTGVRYRRVGGGGAARLEGGASILPRAHLLPLFCIPLPHARALPSCLMTSHLPPPPQPMTEAPRPRFC